MALTLLLLSVTASVHEEVICNSSAVGSKVSLTPASPVHG